MPLRSCISLLLCLAAEFSFAQHVDTIKTYYAPEVIVSGSRAGGNVLDIPMSVSVIALDRAASVRQFSVGDALSAVPGLLAQTRAGAFDVRLTIRGFGARGNGDRSNAGTVRGIKVLVDGIPETEPDGRTALDLIDIRGVSRVEVNRSNASTLFGNASGGVIDFRSHGPSEHSAVELSFAGGAFGLQHMRFSASSGASSLPVSVAVNRSQWNGWRKNSDAASTHARAVAAVTWGDGDGLRFIASGVSNRFAIPGPLTPAQVTADPTQANPAYAARRERRENQITRFSMDLTTTPWSGHAFNVIAFVSPKSLIRSERGTYREFSRVHLGGGGVYTFTEDDSACLLHSIVAGVDVASQDGPSLFYSLVHGERGDSLRTNKREAATTAGAFLQMEIRLTSALRLSVGGRLDLLDYRLQENPTGALRESVEDELTLRRFSPKASLLFRVADRQSLYVSVSGGVEAPAFNEVDPPPTLTSAGLNPLLKPMTSTSIEIGWKGFEELEALRQHLEYSVALFRIGVANEIVPYNGGAYYFSAGRSRRFGFEASATMDAEEPWGVRLAYTYMNARYEEYANELGDFAGKEVPGIPSHVVSARFIVNPFRGLKAEIGVDGVSSYPADDENFLIVPASWLASLNAAYVVTIDPLLLRIDGGLNNLLNRSHISSAYINSVSGAFLEPGLPRNWFASVCVSIRI